MNIERRELAFLIFLLIIAGVLSFFIFKSFLTILVLATVFAITLAPVYAHIKIEAKNEGLSALLTILVMIVFIAIPLVFIGVLIWGESRNLFTTITHGGTDSIIRFLQTQADKLEKLIPFNTEHLDINLYAQKMLGSLTLRLGTIFGNIISLIGNILLFFIALYYFLKDGRKIRARFATLSPLRDKDDAELIDRVILSIESLLRGTLLIAIIKGVLSAIGFSIFGISNPILWGLVAGLASFIPGVGNAIVFVPACLLLFFQGHSGAMIGLIIWGVIVVGLVDNFLGPKLMGRGTNLHPLLVLLSVIGGLSVFGPAGFILGPVILSLFFTLVNILYSERRA